MAGRREVLAAWPRTLAHEAGADLKDCQDQAGHSSIVWTADCYTSVTPTVQRS